MPPSQTAITDTLKRDIMLAINCARVGTIVSFDPGAAGVRPPTATVQIAQQQVTSVDFEGNQTLAPFSELTLVPVLFPGGGGYSLTFPVEPGDECLLIFHDRELDNWYLNGAGLAPSLPRLHDLADAIALVGMRSSPRALASISTNTVQLRSDDASTYIEVAGSQIVNIVAPGGVNVTTPTFTVNGKAVITETIQVENTGAAATASTVNGGFSVTGGDIVADGISLKTHVHGGVQTGSGDTGAPV